MTLRYLVGSLVALLVVVHLRGQVADPEAIDGLGVAAKIHGLVQQYFAHGDGIARDQVDAAYRKYLADVRGTAANDRRGFDLATLRFIATLRNGHTQFIDDRADGRPLKFRLLKVEDQWVVLNTQDAGVPRGAIVVTIDGKAVDDVVRELAQYVAASNDRLAQTHVFSYPLLFPERISLGLKTGTVVVVDRSVRSDVGGQIIPRTPEGRWLEEPEIAFVRVPAFGDPTFERSAIDLIRRFSSAPNLIIDVRGNGGGTTPGQLIEALMNRPWRTWQEITPQAPRPSRQHMPSASAFGGRVFILIDRFCGSACEDFVMPFKDTGRAVLIGETTQGSSGNPYRADLGNGMRVSIGAIRYRFPNGQPFEGIGIDPDVPVNVTVADLQSGRDAALARARELATAK
jgi:carboxyl-terminal processing protease